MTAYFRRIIRTNHYDYTLVILRIAVGLIHLPFCFQGIDHFVAVETYSQEISSIIFTTGFIFILLELVFIVFLVFGFAVRITAMALIVVLFCHVCFTSFSCFEIMSSRNEFLNIGNYKVLVLFFTVSIVLVKRGSGPLSVDAFLIRKSNQNS